MLKIQTRETRPRLKRLPASYSGAWSHKVQAQARIGRRLVYLMDLAAKKAGMHRNDWMIAACLFRLGPGADLQDVVPDDAVVAATQDKTPTIVRIGRSVLDKIDQDVVARDLPTRTVWLIDAFLVYLTHQKVIWTDV